jgi:hypothetical protein
VAGSLVSKESRESNEKFKKRADHPAPGHGDWLCSGDRSRRSHRISHGSRNYCSRSPARPWSPSGLARSLGWEIGRPRHPATADGICVAPRLAGRSVEFEEQINTGKQSVVLVHGIFLVGSKGKELRQIGLVFKWIQNSREFLRIVADSRGDQDLH